MSEPQPSSSPTPDQIGPTPDQIAEDLVAAQRLVQDLRGQVEAQGLQVGPLVEDLHAAHYKVADLQRQLEAARQGATSR